MRSTTWTPRRLLWLILAGLTLAPAATAYAEQPAGNGMALPMTVDQLAAEDNATRQQAIETLAETRDPRAARALEAYQKGLLYAWPDREQVVLCPEMTTDAEGGKFAELHDPLTGKPLKEDGKPIILAEEALRELYPGLREQQAVRDAVRRLNLWSPDAETRREAIKACGNSSDPKFLAPLEEVLKATADSEPEMARAARESLALIRLGRGDVSRADRLAAARDLGEMRSARALPALRDRLEELEDAESGSAVATAEAERVYKQAIEEIESYQRLTRGLGYLFSGLSLGSVLILMALGLSIIFGLMGVINMAHGELMMIGAYATYEMQRLFVAYLPESAFNWYYIAALPVAFLSAAVVGYLIELFVARHLYGRPLDTLLATWGVSLVLIQAVRLRYGDNIAVNNPTWLRGGAEVMQGLILPYNRCFIILLCALCVLLLYWLMNSTKLGLLVRATMQNRATADSLGVNTRRIDGYTFALGAGMAGIAGYALTLIGGVTPDMGQNYIVDSFLVVVTGGVGKLAGAVCAGLGIGVLNKMLEPIFAAVWGKVLILIGVVLFIQWRPAGLFPPKGRLADV